MGGWGAGRGTSNRGGWLKRVRGRDRGAGEGDRKSQSRHRPEGMDQIHGRQSIMNLESDWAGGRDEGVGESRIRNKVLYLGDCRCE